MVKGYKVDFAKGKGEFLIPATDFSADYLAAIPYGDVVELQELNKTRDPQAFRKFWKMIDIAHKNLPESEGHKTRDAFRKEVLVKAGFYHPHIFDFKGEELIYKEPMSMAFDAMDQRQFRAVWRRVHSYLYNTYQLNNAFFYNFI